jgi:hypothetical protein
MKLHIEELHNFAKYNYNHQINKDETGRARSMYKVLVGKAEGKRPTGRDGRRWEDNIKIDLIEIGWDIMD